MMILFALWACSSEPVPEIEPEILPGCGNGIVEPDEQCDDGESNSDSAPDACRSSCRFSECGDGVSDESEECDDGNLVGGDGCTPGCVLESGELDVEPNDSWDSAQVLGSGSVTGSLGAGDVDCFSMSVEECHTVAAELTGECPTPVVLALHAPNGSQVASSGFDEDGCAVLDPVEEPGARFAEEGTWAVCATALVDEEVPAYTLQMLSDESDAFNLPLSDTSDFDGDGLIDDCDGDRDGDGIDNDGDNCPDIPNGPTNISPSVDSSGFIRHWLTVGPFTGEKSTDSCMPTDVERLGVDAEAVPSLGETIDGETWRVFIAGSAHVDFVPDYASVDAPREVYAVTWVFSPEQRALTIGLGPDDGARVWLNGELVQEVSGCQGVVVDKFTEEVTLLEGWNRLLLKVYDQGGGWGTYVRFLDSDGSPVTDLELSLSDSGSWDFDQSDQDGDGIGDICDDD